MNKRSFFARLILAFVLTAALIVLFWAWQTGKLDFQAQVTTSISYVTLNAPNGGECFVPGASTTISWTKNNTDHVDIYFRPQGTATGQTLVSAANYGTTQTWTVPGTTTSSARIYIEAHDAHDPPGPNGGFLDSLRALAHGAVLGTDTSDGPFTINTLCAPPSISNINVSNITASGAVITWTTNQTASSYVDFGQTSSYGSTAGSGTLVTSHSVSLTGLSASTTYHYRVRSANALGRQTTSSDRTFTTAAAPPPPPPPPPPSPTCNTGSVGTRQFVGCLWDGTNYNTADGNAPSGPVLSSPVPTSATALNLDWGNGGPNSTVGSDTFSARWKGSFTFPAGTYTFTGGSDDGLRVRVNGTTRLDQWRDRPYSENSFTQTFSSQTFVTIEIDFYERVGFAKLNFRWAPSSVSTPLPSSPSSRPQTPSPPPASPAGRDSTPPTISDIVGISSTTSATITWTTNEPANSYVDYGLETTYGSEAGQNDAVTAHTVTITDLAPGTTYYFRVKSNDAAGNRAFSDAQTIQTLAETSVVLPVLTDVLINGTSIFATQPIETPGGQTIRVKTGDTLTLKGTAQPQVTVNVYMLSSDELVFSTTADTNGIWTIDLPMTDLAPGEHKIEIATTHNGGETTPRLFLLSFLVEGELPEGAPAARGRFFWYIIGAMVVLFLFGAAFLYRKYFGGDGGNLEPPSGDESEIPLMLTARQDATPTVTPTVMPGHLPSSNFVPDQPGERPQTPPQQK